MIGVYATGEREPRHAREREGDPWNRMVPVVPRPWVLASPRAPPQLSTSRRAMARPRPEPLDVVEKAGSKTRGRTSAAIPRPSSSTASPHPPSEMRTVTRRAPALRAFSSRLIRTSLTSSRSEEHTSELQSLAYLVCRLLLEKKKLSLPGSLLPPAVITADFAVASRHCSFKVPSNRAGGSSSYHHRPVGPARVRLFNTPPLCV